MCIRDRSITDLCAVYAAAGVNCIDVAADIAVVHAAKKGLDWVESHLGIRPWLMVSVSDGKDVHFRKASFNPSFSNMLVIDSEPKILIKSSSKLT